jgi:very-short-patch-repair endonuclease
MSVARTFARELRGNLTDAETKLWSWLRRRQIDGHRFRRQAPIRNYIVDFVCFEARIVVEVDGGQHAESKRDAVRSAFLESQGFRVLRFWNNDVLQNTDGVITTIRAALVGYPPP